MGNHDQLGLAALNQLGDVVDAELDDQGLLLVGLREGATERKGEGCVKERERED